jgi:hypothetical protein
MTESLRCTVLLCSIIIRIVQFFSFYSNSRLRIACSIGTVYTYYKYTGIIIFLSTIKRRECRIHPCTFSWNFVYFLCPQFTSQKNNNFLVICALRCQNLYRLKSESGGRRNVDAPSRQQFWKLEWLRKNRSPWIITCKTWNSFAELTRNDEAWEGFKRNIEDKKRNPNDLEKVRTNL